MLDQPGISLENLSWIQRDQFTHYMTLARPQGGQPDWTTLRSEVLAALTAAFGLDVCDGSHSPGAEVALAVIDDVRATHDPSTNWHSFVTALWRRRHTIRPDLL